MLSLCNALSSSLLEGMLTPKLFLLMTVNVRLHKEEKYSKVGLQCAENFGVY